MIYDMFDRAGLKILRIDQFDSGNFAKIRTELIYDTLSVAQLLEITTRLMSLGKNENLEIHIVNIDMLHKTMRVDILTREEEDTIFQMQQQFPVQLLPISGIKIDFSQIDFKF